MRLYLDEWHWLNLVSRDWWGAEPPDSTVKLNHPVPWVRLCYEDIRFEIKDTVLALRETQRYHMKVPRYPDIAHNFLVDVEGTIYEGRGWDYEGDRPFFYYGVDGKCIEICLIGNYKKEEVEPPWEQLHAAYSLIMYGIKEKYISPQYRTIGMRDEFGLPPYEM